MKKSEELKKLASEEENNLKAMGIMKKSLKEARLEKFKELLPRLEIEYFVVEDNFKYTIDTSVQGRFGIIDYFPKSNKLLIRKDNKWINDGLSWIKTHLIW